MKKFTDQFTNKLIFPIALMLFISLNCFAHGQNKQGSTAPTVQVETIVIKTPGIKSDEVFLKYKNFLSGLKGVTILGRVLENEYLFIEIDLNKNQVIDVLQPLKDNGYYFEFLYDNPTPQKLQEILSNDPLVN